MSILKEEGLKRFIPIDMFHQCLIDGASQKEIAAFWKKPATYYLQKFDKYLKDKHNTNIKEYCIKYLNFEWPKCPTCGEDVGYITSCGKGLLISRYVKISSATCPKMAEAFKKISEDRKGSGNPMYGKEAWNKGLDRTHPVVNYVASLREGVKTSEEVKRKQSESAKKRTIHGHTGIKHSPETITELRENTARLWAEGRFNRVTSIHLKVREFLESIKEQLIESPQEEFQVKYFSMDFAFPEAKIAVECQGTYFHIDPRVYPNGPINAMQRRNFGRDKAKKKYCDKIGWKIIDLWEIEINDGRFKEQLLCKLRELNLLKS